MLDSSSDSESEDGSSDSGDSSSEEETSVHLDGVMEPASEEDLADENVTATVLCLPAVNTADVMGRDSLGHQYQEQSDNDLRSPVMDTVDLLDTTDRENRLDKVETGSNEYTFNMQMEMTSATIDHQ